MTAMARGESKRNRLSVFHRGQHIGYATIISYSDRDLTAFSEGSPYREVVIAELGERHVALLQRYKEHWLIQCGPHYRTSDRPGELSADKVQQLARFALLQAGDPEPVLAGLLKARVDGMLTDT